MAQIGFKNRIYPTREQAELLNQYFGASRYVWNIGLSMISSAWSNRELREEYFLKPNLTWLDVGKQITILKGCPEHGWMKDVPADVYAHTLRNLDKAYKNFFAGRAKYPRYKRKTFGQSITFTFDQRHAGKIQSWIKDQELVLPKLGRLKMKQGLPIEAPKSITVRRTASGCWYASFMVEQVIKPYPKALSNMAIDVGLKDFVVGLDDLRVPNPKHLDQLDRALRRQQRRLSRKQKGSKRREKQRIRVARLHERIRASREDFLHKLSSSLIKSHDWIAIESLNIKGMVKNHRLARSIHDASWATFVGMLKYKASWYGREIVEIDKWFPSTKLCSTCGEKTGPKDLSVRSWVCTNCFAEHDRDKNAAWNIWDEAIAIG